MFRILSPHPVYHVDGMMAFLDTKWWNGAVSVEKLIIAQLLTTLHILCNLNFNYLCSEGSSHYHQLHTKCIFQKKQESKFLFVRLMHLAPKQSFETNFSSSLSFVCFFLLQFFFLLHTSHVR